MFGSPEKKAAKRRYDDARVKVGHLTAGFIMQFVQCETGTMDVGFFLSDTAPKIATEFAHLWHEAVPNPTHEDLEFFDKAMKHIVGGVPYEHHTGRKVASQMTEMIVDAYSSLIPSGP